MATKRGTGHIYKRGKIYWVKLWVDGTPVFESSKSTKHSDAVKLLAKLQGKKSRNEIVKAEGREVLISELLDDVVESDIEASTKYIWGLVIEKNLRPFFGHLKASRLTTAKIKEYRKKRTGDGVADSTVNRELTILRTAFNNARKEGTVYSVPHFHMVTETTVRDGFLTDAQYIKLRDALPMDIKPLFVCAYNTGMRKSELLSITWNMVDFEQGMITLPARITKTKKGRNVPILAGDMEGLLRSAKQERDAGWPTSPHVFNRHGKRITDFRTVWAHAVKAAGVPDLIFHDLRRTAVKNMSRAGVPQVIRMAISGHKTDSMERRYNIVDNEDLADARRRMETRQAATD